MKLLPPPGPERRRQFGLLTILGIALATWGAYKYWPATAAGPAAASNVDEKAGASADKKILLPDPVKLSDLEPAPDAAPPSRNPFRFGQKPLPPPPPPAPQPVYVPPVVQAPPQPQGPPEIKLKCIGVDRVVGGTQWFANVQDPDTGAAQWVKEGDVIDGRYKVGKVTADSVEVSYRDGTGKKVLFNGR